MDSDIICSISKYHPISGRNCCNFSCNMSVFVCYAGSAISYFTKFITTSTNSRRTIHSLFLLFFQVWILVQFSLVQFLFCQHHILYPVEGIQHRSISDMYWLLLSFILYQFQSWVLWVTCQVVLIVGDAYIPSLIYYNYSITQFPNHFNNSQGLFSSSA